MAQTVVYRSKPGRGDKPPYSSAAINDFKRSLSFAAIRSSFDKMLVEMDQNTYRILVTNRGGSHYFCRDVSPVTLY